MLTFIPSATSQNLQLRYFFRLFPAFCLGDGLLQLALCSDNQCPVTESDGYSFTNTQSPLGWDITLQNITFMAVESVVFFSLTIIIENSLMFPFMTSFLYHVDNPEYEVDQNEDIDVSEERQRVMSGLADSDIICLKELRKVYPMNSKSGGVRFPTFLKQFIRFMMSFFKNTNLGSVEKLYEVKVAVESLCFGIPKRECFGFLGIVQNLLIK